MEIWIPVTFSDGHTGGVACGLLSKADVILPASEVDSMTDEEIASHVRILAERSKICEIEADAEHYMGNDPEYFGIATLYDYLERFKPYIEISSMCRRAVERLKVDIPNYRGKGKYERKEPAPKQKRAGYVYLLCNDKGHYKIGKSVDIANRQKTFGVLLPFDVEFIHVIKSDQYTKLELSLHEKFASKRINGEWFALNADDIAYIKSL